jgi:ZIP family zinc transporter
MGKQFFLGMLFFFGMTLLIPESGHGEHSHAHSKAAAAASEPSGSPRSSPVRRRRGSVGSAAERSGEKEKPKKRGGKAVAKSAEQRRLLRVGLDTALGIALHNIPEGIAVYLASLSGMQVGAALAVAIAAHNIPEGMAVAAPVLTATGSRFRAILCAPPLLSVCLHASARLTSLAALVLYQASASPLPLWSPTVPSSLPLLLLLFSYYYYY